MKSMGVSAAKNEAAKDHKKNIIKKSTELFFEKGYDNTTTRELAVAAGLSNAGIYYYFKDKEDILFQIVEGSVAYLLDAVRLAINVANKPEENLRQVIIKLLEVVFEHRMEIGLLIKESQRLNSEQLKLISGKRRETLELVKDEVNRLKTKGKLKELNVSVVTFSLMAITNWPFYWYKPSGSLTIEEMAAELADLFFHGVLTEE